MEQTEQIEQLVKYIVDSLVENKEAVKVVSEKDDIGVMIKVTVAEDEAGKVIGKNGKIAQSIRTVVRSAAAKSGIKYIIKIN